MKLPTAIGNAWELGEFCGKRLVGDEETNEHGVGEIWREMNTDGDGNTMLALGGGIGEDVNEAVG